MGIGSWEEIFTPDRVIAIGQGFLRLMVVLVLTRVAVSLSSFAVDRSLDHYRRRTGGDGRESRAQTIGALLKSVSRYALYFIGFVWALDAVGIRAGSVLAAAGIGGLAVGFGAQNLVRDVISGFFILFEDQYEVGEYVTVNGSSGVIQEVGLRSTCIRAFAGDVYFIPNGAIQTVTNHSRNNMRAWVEIRVAYEQDHNRAIQVAQEACDQLKQEVDFIVDGPKVMGIQKLGESDVVLSIWALAKNMKQWETERRIRKMVKEAFERQGVEIPFPRRVVYHRYEEDGEVPDVAGGARDGAQDGMQDDAQGGDGNGQAGCSRQAGGHPGAQAG